MKAFDLIDTASSGRHKRLEEITARCVEVSPMVDLNILNAWDAKTDEEQRRFCAMRRLRISEFMARSEFADAIGECERGDFALLADALDRADFCEFGRIADRLMRRHVGNLVARGL